MGPVNPASVTQAMSTAQPIILLIRKLHDTLNKSERFPVVLNDISGSAGAGLKMLTQPLRLKFEKGCKDSFVNIKCIKRSDRNKSCRIW